jgi:aspartate kinase
VDETQLAAAMEITAASLAALMETDIQTVRDQIQSDGTIAKVSISGAGMIGRPGVAAQMFQALAEAGINIQMISTSEIKVSCVIDRADFDAAIVALCQAFDLKAASETRMGVEIGEWGQTPQAPRGLLAAVRGVALDENQAELAIRSVPDRPGMAAQIFGLLAKHLISVDMIIQSQRCTERPDGVTRDIACTVSKGDALTAQAVLMEAAEEFGFGRVEVNTDVAKVSIVGSGMVYEAGVAAKMFTALAQEQINIQMIGTSEIKTSCLVSDTQGKTAVAVIHEAFGLGTERM